MTAINPLSQTVQNMAESATIKMSQLARELKAEGKDVISLSLGEPDFDTPNHIKEAAKVALDEGYTKYTPVSGLMEFRKAICEKFKRDNALEFQPNQIMVSNGSKQCIANLAMALLDKGDEAIIFAPYWVSYSAIVEMVGGKVVPVAAGIEQDFKITPTQLEEAITNKTKIVLFSSPCNPTGSVYTRSELEALANVIAKYDDIIIIADEIYEYINFTGQHASIGSIESVRDRTVTTNGFAKGYAMTGWRLGYMGGPKWVVDACSKIQGQFTSGANAFGQKAAITALLGDMNPTYEMRKAFLKRRNMMIELLREIPGMKVNVPTGAFYLFPDISNFFGKSFGDIQINNSIDFCEYILYTALVATVPGKPFGNDNCFRLSYAASEENLREAVRRIKEAVAKLK